MSVADEFDVYLFPHDLPVNLATPADLTRLRDVFSGRTLYLAVGADVIANASSYRVPPCEGSVHSLNHLVFRRSDETEGRDIDADLSRITGEVLQLRLKRQLEEISSTRIRENIDLGRDIGSLIDPAVQDFIYRNSLYLREPQYKQLIGGISGLPWSQPDSGLGRADRRPAESERCCQSRTAFPFAKTGPPRIWLLTLRPSGTGAYSA